MRLPQPSAPALGSQLQDLGCDLLEAVFPALCPVCSQASIPGCSAGGCGQHRLPAAEERLPGPRCDRCAQALPGMLPDGTRCAACRRRPPRTRHVVALGEYQSNAGLRDWVLSLKHRSRLDLAQPLGRALGARLENVMGAPPRSALLVPVPLHPLRRIQRGYDQARHLAGAAAEFLGVSQRPMLQRRRWTAPQGAPGAASRGANVHGAFGLAKTQDLDLQGVQVWLVDDVITSGATADACAALLAAQGARRIGVLCLARAGSPETFA